MYSRQPADCYVLVNVENPLRVIGPFKSLRAAQEYRSTQGIGDCGAWAAVSTYSPCKPSTVALATAQPTRSERLRYEGITLAAIVPDSSTVIG